MLYLSSGWGLYPAKKFSSLMDINYRLAQPAIHAVGLQRVGLKVSFRSGDSATEICYYLLKKV